MKKRILCFALFSVIALNSVGCESLNNSKQSITHKTVVQSIKKDGICNVSIDPKVELLSVVQYLADDPNIVKYYNDMDEEKYSDDIVKNFLSYRDEPVVRLYKNMMEKGFCFDTPPRAMLYVDNNLKPLKAITFPEDILNNSGGKEALLKFLNSLADFRKKSKFDKFYMSHTNYYNNIVSSVKNRVDKSGCIEKLVEYYGYKQNSFNIIIQPLSSGGYAGRIPAKDGKFDVYDFMVVPNKDEEFSNLLIHEFGHSYVNPLSEQNITEVNKYNNLFTTIKESMSRQAYGEWNICVNEHIVRSATYRILYNLYGANVSQAYIKRDTANNFVYINSLYERLTEYENNRDKYPTFKDFYPRILDVFKNLSNKNPL